jgi:hypothetical protein
LPANNFSIPLRKPFITDWDPLQGCFVEDFQKTLVSTLRTYGSVDISLAKTNIKVLFFTQTKVSLGSPKRLVTQDMTFLKAGWRLVCNKVKGFKINVDKVFDP